MYLIPYVICGLIFSGALIICLRIRAANGMDTYQGVASRASVSVLLLAFVAVIWYYATEENMESAKIELWSRIISAAIYIYLLPQIWADDKGPQKKEQ